MKEHEIKARALVLSFQLLVKDFEMAKQCALISVSEVIATCPQKENEIFAVSKGMKYWESVNKSINKL